MRSVINGCRLNTYIERFSFRDLCLVNPDDFAANVRMTDIYADPANDFDSFCWQLLLLVLVLVG